VNLSTECLLLLVESHRIDVMLVLGIGLLKLFGSACRNEPAETLAKFDRFTSFLFSMIDSCDTDSSLLGVAVETVGFIGSTAHGKHALEQQCKSSLDLLLLKMCRHLVCR